MSFFYIYLSYYSINVVFKIIRFIEISQRSLDERWFKAGFRMNLMSGNWEYMLNYDGITQGKGVFFESNFSKTLTPNRLKIFFLKHILRDSLYDLFVIFNFHNYLWDYLQYNINKARDPGAPYLNEFSPKLNHVIDRKLKDQRGSGYFYKFENYFSFIDFDKKMFVLNFYGKKETYEFRIQGVNIFVRLLERCQGVHDRIGKAPNSGIPLVNLETFSNNEFVRIEDSECNSIIYKLCILSNSLLDCGYELFRSYLIEEVKRCDEMEEEIKLLQETNQILTKRSTYEFDTNSRIFYKIIDGKESNLFYEDILKLLGNRYSINEIQNLMHFHYHYYLCPMFNINDVEKDYRNILSFGSRFDRRYFA